MIFKHFYIFENLILETNSFLRFSWNFGTHFLGLNVQAKCILHHGSSWTDLSNVPLPMSTRNLKSPQFSPQDGLVLLQNPKSHSSLLLIGWTWTNLLKSLLILLQTAKLLLAQSAAILSNVCPPSSSRSISPPHARQPTVGGECNPTGLHCKLGDGGLDALVNLNCGLYTYQPYLYLCGLVFFSICV